MASVIQWRPASPDEDEAIVAMGLALVAEDPGQPVDASQLRRTLTRFRQEPPRGRAIVAVLADGAQPVPSQPIAYAFLVSFWSNEYGGEICAIDELYVLPVYRGRGIATQLLTSVADDRNLWPRRPVALEIESTPANTRARALYERLGFAVRNATLRRVLPPQSA